MVKTLARSITFLILFIPATAAAEQVRLFLDNSRTRYILVEKQDCSVHQTKDGRITVGFKAGLFFFGVGPEISFGNKNGIDWDHSVQHLIVRYQELCTRFNTGSLSKQDYEERLEEIDALEKEGLKFHLVISREKRRHRQNMFDELDRETHSRESLKNSLRQDKSKT